MKETLMKYRYIVPVFFVLTHTVLYAKKDSLDHVSKKSEEKKKQSYFRFIDKNPPIVTSQSESFDYANKSRFEFKFSSGLGENNIVGNKSVGGYNGITGGGAAGSGGRGRGGHR